MLLFCSRGPYNTVTRNKKRSIIQRIVTLPKYDYGALNIRLPWSRDILRYNPSNIFARARLV